MGGRLSNGSAILGNLLSIKPGFGIFLNDGENRCFEKVRTEKKAVQTFAALAEEKRNGA